MVLNVHRNQTATLIKDGEKGVWRWGKREIIYLSLHCHHKKMTSALRWAAMRTILYVSLIVRGKVTRQCAQTKNFEEKGEPKRIVELCR